MKFGYFTLSDNRYPNNPRTPERFLHEIFEQAVYADEIGLNSAWIGEHHFNLLGINPCPNIMLATLASATKKIRLAPAVVLLPVHHPLHVAEETATFDVLSNGRLDLGLGGFLQISKCSRSRNVRLVVVRADRAATDQDRCQNRGNHWLKFHHG